MSTLAAGPGGTLRRPGPHCTSNGLSTRLWRPRGPGQDCCPRLHLGSRAGMAPPLCTQGAPLGAHGCLSGQDGVWESPAASWPSGLSSACTRPCRTPSPLQ